MSIFFGAARFRVDLNVVPGSTPSASAADLVLGLRRRAGNFPRRMNGVSAVSRMKATKGWRTSSPNNSSARWPASRLPTKACTGWRAAAYCAGLQKCGMLWSGSPQCGSHVG